MNKVMKEIINTLLYLLIVLCLTGVIIHFVGQRTEVWGASMETTLSDGDNLIVDKFPIASGTRSASTLLYFPSAIRRIPFISKGLSACRERRCR